MSERKTLAVVGGGIAGLSAAYYAWKNAREQEFDLEVHIFEKQDYWGGKILTERVEGFVIEGGPDTFIVTKPWGIRLCRELGLEDRLHGTNPEHSSTFVLHEGELEPLPEGLMMMVPSRFLPIIRTDLLSWPEKIRMGLDFFLPPADTNGDESLGDFVSRRLGRAAYENLIEPLMSGIYAGDGDQLSLQSTFPYLRELESEHGGLIKGALAVRRRRAQARRTRSTNGASGIFRTPTTGLAEIVEALLGALREAGVKRHLKTAVQRIERSHGGYRLHLGGGRIFPAQGLILATPAYVSGTLLEREAPTLARTLREIPYVSTATVSLVFRQIDLPRPLDGRGYVIPREEGREALACTWTSSKFPHRAPDDYALLRVFIGRAGQEEDIRWTEENMLEIAREEVALTLDIDAQPVFSRVFIWQDAMPQYNLGHQKRLAAIDDALEGLPRLALAGNGYRGIGIPDCIHSGEIAADRVLSHFAA